MPEDCSSPFLNKPLAQISLRLGRKLSQDSLIQNTTSALRETLNVDRIAMYYFYRQWQGQVTFESIASKDLSIFGSTGEDQCFDDELAVMYKLGRVRAIADIELEPIQPCHRDFLRSIQVRANLVVPVLVPQNSEPRLWGLLVAHQVRSPRQWSSVDIDLMLRASHKLATAPSLQEE